MTPKRWHLIRALAETAIVVIWGFVIWRRWLPLPVVFVVNGAAALLVLRANYVRSIARPADDESLKPPPATPGRRIFYRRRIG